jgi:hypothetical protein
MLPARDSLLSQFMRDCQSLRDALIGLTQTQIADPSFSAEGTLRDRLAVVTAHYYRMGEVLAHRMGLQLDAPLDEADPRWRAEAIGDRDEWALSELQADLEDAWTFYRELLVALDERAAEFHLRTAEVGQSRMAFEASRDISAWRLRSG